MAQKKCGRGMGGDGLPGGCGLEVCEAGAGKISPTPARRVYFANAGRKQTKNFN